MTMMMTRRRQASGGQRSCPSSLTSLQFALLAAVLALPGCSTAVSPEDPADIASWMEIYEVPGASIAVINDFELDYVEVHGVKSKQSREPVSERTLFQAASLSKGVSAVAVLSLAQDEGVSLDRDINDYLTSWQVPANALQVTEKVTLRRLLSHTAGTTVSGFRGYRYTEPVPSLIQILNGEPPANSAPIVVDLVPGSEFRYSGGGYEVMEQAVRDVTGATYPDFVGERVLQPIGMANSTYEQPLPDSLRDSAASGYYASGTAVPGGTTSILKWAPRRSGRPPRTLPDSSSSCSCRFAASPTGCSTGRTRSFC